MENLRLIDNETKKEDTDTSPMPHSFMIDYTNTGWGEININEKLPKLIKSAGVNGKIQNCTELSGGYFNKVIMTETALVKNIVKISPFWN